MYTANEAHVVLKHCSRAIVICICRQISMAMIRLELWHPALSLLSSCRLNLIAREPRQRSQKRLCSRIAEPVR